jgi:hypothetical protein
MMNPENEDVVMNPDTGEVYLTRGAAKRFRRYGLLLAFFVIVLGVVSWVSLDTRDNLAEETSARIDGNVRSLVVGCEHVNDLARAVKEIIGSNGTVLTPDDVASFGFEDPHVVAYVQAIVERSQRNAVALRAEGEKIKLLDCEAVAREEAGGGE